MSALDTAPLANILIVDDLPDNLRLLSRMLTDHGYEVRPVLNGAQALTAAQTQPPDLILLDIMMPMLNGFEVCERLKADERTRDIPILFISALSDTESKVNAFTAGGVDYVTKPFQLEEVVARVRTHLNMRALERRLREEIAERDSLRADLLAYAHTVAHDLRPPIGVALGFAALIEMQGDALAAEEREVYLANITQGLRKMNGIVNELLLLAEVREVDIQLMPLRMEGIVKDALRRVADMTQAAAASITAPEAWPPALGYAPWVEEVWVNYLSNAVKYGGRPPQIVIGATPTPNGAVRYWVRDNGDGLSAEQQVDLFTPFTRFDQVRATGYGLGLSIVKRIITKLGGEVGVQSTGAPGQGATFYFTLPGAGATSS